MEENYCEKYIKTIWFYIYIFIANENLNNLINMLIEGCYWIKKVLSYR